MKLAARMLTVLAAISFSAGCKTTPPPHPSASRGADAAPDAPPPGIALGPLAPSPRLIVGRIIAVDAARGFAFVELGADFPPSATTKGAELSTRTLDLKDTGRLQASRYLRGRTLGATILSGKPAAGDEVVWLAP